MKERCGWCGHFWDLHSDLCCFAVGCHCERTPPEPQVRSWWLCTLRGQPFESWTVTSDPKDNGDPRYEYVEVVERDPPDLLD